MNNELLAVLNYMEKERGIERETLFLALEEALLAAARKSENSATELRIDINRETCDIKAIATKQVVEKVNSPDSEIRLADARRIKKDVELGDSVDIESTPGDFGRVAAQTAKQTMMQKIRQVEKDMVYEEYKDRVGTIVTGAVRRFNRSDIAIDLGRAEAVMPSKERVPTEEYQIGDRVRAYVLKVENSASGTEIILSRSHPDFVRRLFELEIAEIADGTVEIKGIAREPGYRTKVAVLSHDARVDCVGACVGMRGVRVKNIVRELSDEKIDIVRWSDDVRTYITNSLSPARLLSVTIDPEVPQFVHVVSEADQLSLAIGKRGQNVRLSAKLVGWKIDIQKDEREVSFDEKIAKAVEALGDIEGITPEQAQALVKSGFLTVEGIASAESADLELIEGFDAETVKTVYDASRAHLKAPPEPGESVVESSEEPAASDDDVTEQGDDAPEPSEESEKVIESNEST
jgi:N utilization substance protein A